MALSLTPGLVCVRCIALVACAGLPAGSAIAQTFPAKIIRVINPAAPGGNSDIFFRLLSPKMTELLGQQLVFDYRPGAGGTVGADIIAKSLPDGYTTGIVAGSFMINPSLMRKLPYDTVKDFAPLGLIVDVPTGTVVHPSLPVKSVKELIAFARAHPGQLNYSSSGPGAVGHLSGELLNSLAGIKLVHIPYKGIGPGIIDLIAGHVQASFASIPVVLPHVRAGRLRLLAQAGAKRAISLPEVPTMEEAGVAGFVVSSGFGFVGPAAIPRPIAEKLNDALARAVRDPANRKALVDQGAEPVGSTIEEHAAVIRSEIDKWRKVVKEAGIEPQ
ncbi:MAG TPA: tripartite tricarboxylate transporter substrate binding protein [Burkholderiales bacterium]|nr:tripartite tricarboxylate transporter substrate binding protein [Burkholderiales bacterium]